MYTPYSKQGFKNVLDKISMKTLVHGDKTMMVEFRLTKGADLPRHSHPHEQTGYLVSGQINLTIGDATHHIEPGGSWCVPGNTKHFAIALEDSIAVEVFSPVREDYIT